MTQSAPVEALGGFAPTDEQQAVIDAGTSTSDSLMVSAYAGCAKSTTSRMLAQALPRQVRGLSLAFNKTNADATRAAFPENFEVLTLNGLGHRTWGKSITAKLSLDDKKLGKITSEVLKETKLDSQLGREAWDAIRRLAALAMSRGLVPSTYQGPSRKRLDDTTESWQDLCDAAWLEFDETLVDVTREVISRDIKLGFSGTISFDDQVYLSAMFSSNFPKFPLTFVDEAQDLSPLNHIMLAQVSSERMVVVGDELQAIYAFRGADGASMRKIAGLRPAWARLPLRTTFRCPRAIVSRVSHHAVGFRCGPGAPSGFIANLSIGRAGTTEDLAERSWTWNQIEVLASRTGAPRPSIAVLCRNNAPLLSLAFRLIRQGVSVQMLGRDIGKGLAVLISKIIKEYCTPADKCAGLINDWRERERGLALANGHDEKLAGIEDRAECLLAILDGAGCTDAAALRAATENLFSRDTGRVVLSTGHRAKGLEWDTVLHLDPWRVPSRFARKRAALGDTSALQQEENLCYVIETRTKHTLVLADLEDFA